MNRDTFQRLADLRVAEARILLDNGHYSGAYYLAGYAVECALKACIAKQVREYDFPDFALARRSYTHKFEELIAAAGLRIELQRETRSNPTFSQNWDTISGENGWEVESRYEYSISENEALALFSAVTDENAGVLPWVKRRW